MFENASLNLFVYIIVGAAIAMALLWFFVIAPIEKRNHDRKLAMLQEKIKAHEERLKAGTATDMQADDDAGQTS